ncbi:unnamed protein product [Brassica oleracea]
MPPGSLSDTHCLSNYFKLRQDINPQFILLHLSISCIHMVVGRSFVLFGCALCCLPA